MYAFVKDRSVDTIDDFSGKSIAILNSDPQMRKFADLAGSSQIDVTLSNFAGKFNRGEIDILIMPALAYNTFELYEGLGDMGGIIDYRLYYGMLQTISKQDEFPEDFGSKMRNYMLTRMKAISKMVRDAEEEIPEKYWIETNQFVKDDINHFSKRVRLALREDDVNNPMALKLFWKIRCRLDPSRGECKEFPAMKSKRDKHLADKKKQQERLVAKRKLAEQQRKKEQESLKENAEQERLEKERLENNRVARELEKLKEQKLALAEARRELEQERLALQKERDQAVDGGFSALKSKESVEGQAAEQASSKLVTQQKVEEQQGEKTITGATEESGNEALAEKEELEIEESKSRSIWDILFGWMF